MGELSDTDHAKRGVAILATCIVQSMNETDPNFKDRFLGKLTDAYYKLRDDTELDESPSLELISWTRTLLTGFDFSTGQGKPFLDD